MQRTAAEQATPHGAPLPELPPELVVSVVRAGKHGLVLVRMLRVCKAWRRAITAESASLWREAALAQFPRLHDILAIAGARPEPPDFRSLYRKQRAADFPSYHRRPLPDLDEYVLSVELLAYHAGQGFVPIARASDRLDRAITYDGSVRTYARMLLTKEATYDEVVGGFCGGGAGGGGADDGVPVKSCFDGCYINVYATRLADMKAIRIVMLEDEGPSEGDYARQREEAGEQGIVFTSYAMDTLSVSMFAGNAGNDENEAVMCAAFNPTQMHVYLDFWEKKPHGHLGGAAAGPEGEMYMAPDELQKYLAYHAPWSLD
jgi:hypothetical protein